MKKKEVIQESEIYIGEFILAKLKEDQHSIAWLAREIHTDASNLGRQLKSRKNLHSTQLFDISKALKTDFFQPYSEKLNVIFDQERKTKSKKKVKKPNNEVEKPNVEKPNNAVDLTVK